MSSVAKRLAAVCTALLLVANTTCACAMAASDAAANGSAVHAGHAAMTVQDDLASQTSDCHSEPEVDCCPGCELVVAASETMELKAGRAAKTGPEDPDNAAPPLLAGVIEQKPRSATGPPAPVRDFATSTPVRLGDVLNL